MAESLRHSGAADCDQEPAGDVEISGVAERTVHIFGQAINDHHSVVHLDWVVDIDPVSNGIYVNVAAVDPVIVGDQGDHPIVDLDIGTFDPFLRLSDVQRAAGDQEANTGLQPFGADIIASSLGLLIPVRKFGCH